VSYPPEHERNLRPAFCPIEDSGRSVHEGRNQTHGYHRCDSHDIRRVRCGSYLLRIDDFDFDARC
jgi:hypothetical protein